MKLTSYARSAEQLTDSLGAIDLDLPETALAGLDAVSALEPRFPSDRIARIRGFAYGPADDLVEHR